MASVDASEVYGLAAEMRGAPWRAEREARKVMKRSALGIKRTMQGDFTGHGHAPRVQFSLEFQRVGPLAYDIGELDSAGSQWGIAAILAYGTSNNAPVVDHTQSLHRETPLMERYLGDAAENAVFKGPE